MSATALLFPGQGSQTTDMRDTVERAWPELLELAADAVGDDPFARVDEGTRFAQPAILCAALAGWVRLGRPDADLYAGHSLGEIGALAAAGALDAEDAVRLVALRGRLMQEAAERTPGEGMLALLGRGGGASAAAAAEIAADHGLTLANDNAPGQVVLAGPGDALSAAAAHAEASGLRAMRLPVRGAFHSSSMTPAVPEFLGALERVEFREPRAPVFSCVTAQPFDDPRRRLAEALDHGVRWRETLVALHGRGARRFVETGPGRVLTGLVRRTLADVEAIAGERLEPAHA